MYFFWIYANRKFRLLYEDASLLLNPEINNLNPFKLNWYSLVAMRSEDERLIPCKISEEQWTIADNFSIFWKKFMVK